MLAGISVGEADALLKRGSGARKHVCVATLSQEASETRAAVLGVLAIASPVPPHRLRGGARRSRSTEATIAATVGSPLRAVSGVRNRPDGGHGAVDWPALGDSLDQRVIASRFAEVNKVDHCVGPVLRSVRPGTVGVKMAPRVAEVALRSGHDGGGRRSGTLAFRDVRDVTRIIRVRRRLIGMASTITATTTAAAAALLTFAFAFAGTTSATTVGAVDNGVGGSGSSRGRKRRRADGSRISSS